MDMEKTTILPEDPENALLRTTADMIGHIERTKIALYDAIRSLYAQRLPELAALVVDRGAYCAIVHAMGNFVNLSEMGEKIEMLRDHLPSQLCAALLVVASVSRGTVLATATASTLLDATEEFTSLESVKQILLDYLSSRIMLLAPNLCNLIGPGIAAQLFGLSGSLVSLCEMSPETVASLGKSSGQSSDASAPSHLLSIGGYLLNSDLVQSQPAEVRHKIVRMVSHKVVLAARVDAYRYAPDGSKGYEMRSYLCRRMEEWNADNNDPNRNRSHAITGAGEQKLQQVKAALLEGREQTIASWGLSEGNTTGRELLATGEQSIGDLQTNEPQNRVSSHSVLRAVSYKPQGSLYDYHKVRYSREERERMTRRAQQESARREVALALARKEKNKGRGGEGSEGTHGRVQVHGVGGKEEGEVVPSFTAKRGRRQK